jgi:hypothetical protein
MMLELRVFVLLGAAFPRVKVKRGCVLGYAKEMSWGLIAAEMCGFSFRSSQKSVSTLIGLFVHEGACLIDMVYEYASTTSD